VSYYGYGAEIGARIGRRIDEQHLRECFICCPLCGSRSIQTYHAPLTKTIVSCRSCGARWHVKLGFTGVNKARLEVKADDGKGKELLGTWIKKDELRRMADEARTRHAHITVPRTLKEKETVIKEIVLIPCAYCGSLMPQTSIFCPYCGARRKA